MRILFIANDFPNPLEPTKGVFNRNLVRALSAEHEVRVIAPIPWIDEHQAGANGRSLIDPTRRSVLDGVEVRYPRYYYPPKVMRNLYGSFYWWSIRSTVWQMLNEGPIPDAVVAYWCHPDGEAAVRIGRFLGIPSAVLVGGSDVLLLAKDPGRRKCIVRVLNDIDAVLTVSEDLRQKVIELGIAPAKVHVWRQGVDLASFFPGDRAAARRQVGVAPDARAILWVGRMVPVKALDVLTDACARLRDRGVDFHLYLVGDGPLADGLRSDVAARGLSDRVTFAGARLQEQLPDWYRAADVTVLPSWSEGLPNVLRESIACGTPFVASRVGGIPEIADPAVDRLVPAGNSKAFADALQAVLDAAVRSGPEPKGDASQARTSRSLGWSDSARALVDILRPLVESSQDEMAPWWAGRVRPDAGRSPGRPAGKWSPRQVARAVMHRSLPRSLFLVQGPQRSKSVCLTFDDGPHPEQTARLLDVLKEHKVRATFFVVGRMVEKHPEVLRRIVAEGHLVGNHTYYHPDISTLSPRDAVRGANYTRRMLAELTGQRVNIYRPPRGKISARKLLCLWGGQHTLVLWNVDPKDYLLRSGEKLRAWFHERPLRGGDIVLLHDRLPYACDVLPELIADARRRGLEFGTLDEWMGRKKTIGPFVRPLMNGPAAPPSACDEAL